MLTFPQKYMLPQQSRLRSVDVTQTQDSQGGIDHTNRIGYKHKWAIDITTPKLKYSDVMALFSFACQLGGKYSPCLVPNPYPTIGSADFLTQSREITPQGAQSVALFNLPSAKTNLLLPGDFIQFVDHSKVYMVTLPLNSNGAGQGTVSFTPPLRKNVAQNVPCRVGDRVFFTMRLKSDKQDIQLRADQGKESPVKIEFEEYIND